MILRQNTQFFRQLMYEHVFQAAIWEFSLWKHIHTGSRPIQTTIKSTSIHLWVYNSSPHICMLPWAQCLATGVTMFMVYEVFVVVVGDLLSSGMPMCSLVDNY